MVDGRKDEAEAWKSDAGGVNPVRDDSQKQSLKKPKK